MKIDSIRDKLEFVAQGTDASQALSVVGLISQYEPKIAEELLKMGKVNQKFNFQYFDQHDIFVLINQWRKNGSIEARDLAN